MRIRTILLLVGTLAAAPVAVALAAGPVAVLASALAPATGRDHAIRLTGLTVEDVVAGLCGATLLVATGLWTLGLLLGLAEQVGGAVARAARAVPCPALVRGLALGALGLGLVLGPPASADPQGSDSRARGRLTCPQTVLTGLVLPDRVATAAQPSPRATTVRPGDTLWAIAAHALAVPAPEVAVDHAWRRIAAANRDSVPDPDLIFPGTELRVPPLDDLLGKD
jgi:nucleoid-associated protein YgaU